MLIRVTERCQMGCSHCMIDAQPDGAHMHLALYRRVIEFTARMDKIAMLSGGEPTEHPQILEMISHAVRKRLITVVLSNGLFLDTPKRNKLLESGAFFQITNDPRYYPRSIPEIVHPALVIERQIRGTIIGLGRAQQSIGKSVPGCFNLRSCVHYGDSLKQAIHRLRLLGKFCTPSINIDGTLAAGESNQCYRAGWIGDPLRTLAANLIEHNCDRCRLHHQLDQRHLKAIGKG